MTAQLAEQREQEDSDYVEDLNSRDLLSREHEIRMIVVAALARVRNWDIDLEEEYSYVELSDSVDALDEDAFEIVKSLAKAGYIEI
jgi:hypothetical protein